ncbi:MAG TPA: phage holin family protein [Usitatibacter sp.]|nr:phage holin family protein [Usitatibacter sp.]
MSRHADGLLGTARGLAALGVRAVRTRLELLEIELATEKARIVRWLGVTALAVYLLSFGTLLGILWLALALPEQWRLAALGLAALAFLAGGAIAVAWLLRHDVTRQPMLATLVAVLERDEEALDRPAR